MRRFDEPKPITSVQLGGRSSLPAKAHDADGRHIVWNLPLYNNVHNV
jgi:hypothetical protein